MDAMTTQITRRERERLQHRNEILDAGIALFARRGHFGTRLEDVGERAGFSRAAVYLHFPGGKDELYAESLMQALRYRGQVLKETLMEREAELAAGTLSESEVISLIWGAFRRLYEERPDYVRVIAFLGHENMFSVLSDSTRQVLGHENTAMFEMIDDAISGVQGSIRALPMLHSAWTIWSFFLGTVQFAHSAHVAKHPEAGDLLDSALIVLLRGTNAA
jgi:AcrR family transcriptional regulator